MCLWAVFYKSFNWTVTVGGKTELSKYYLTFLIKFFHLLSFFSRHDFNFPVRLQFSGKMILILRYDFSFPTRL